ncbi:MAG: hypothetical protein ACRENE_13335, partial [Polyangiaceae bacterium]
MASFNCGKCGCSIFVEAPLSQVNCPRCGAPWTVEYVQPPVNRPSFDLGKLLLGAVGVGVAFAGGYKASQTAFDSWEGAGGDSLEFSRSFKIWFR